MIFSFTPPLSFLGLVPLLLRDGGRIRGIAEVTLNKWLLVTGGKKSLLSHWFDLFPSVAHGLCHCVGLLSGNGEHGAICFWREMFIFKPSPRIAQRGQPCLPLSCEQSLAPVLLGLHIMLLGSWPSELPPSPLISVLSEALRNMEVFLLYYPRAEGKLVRWTQRRACFFFPRKTSLDYPLSLQMWVALVSFQVSEI